MSLLTSVQKWQNEVYHKKLVSEISFSINSSDHPEKKCRFLCQYWSYLLGSVSQTVTFIVLSYSLYLSLAFPFSAPPPAAPP